MSTESIHVGAFIVCTYPDKPMVNAIIKNTKFLYQNDSNHQFGGVLKGVPFPTK